jgi:ERO1-like protein alpha
MYDDDHWKADFNKAVSGLHSMISAQVIIGIQEKIDSGEEFTNDERWKDPVAEFRRRLFPDGETPLAIENLYFCFMLLLSAVSKAKHRLLADCESGKIDEEAAQDLPSVLSSPLFKDSSVGVASKKLHDHAVKDLDSVQALWEARMRTRDLYRIMNCVQCNKCRLHGKISTMGLSTALQILIGPTGEGGDVKSIHRVELAALLSCVYKFSKAIDFCQQMR